MSDDGNYYYPSPPIEELDRRYAARIRAAGQTDSADIIDRLLSRLHNINKALGLAESADLATVLYEIDRRARALESANAAGSRLDSALKMEAQWRDACGRAEAQIETLDKIREYCTPAENFTQSEYRVCRDVLEMIVERQEIKS